MAQLHTFSFDVEEAIGEHKVNIVTIKGHGHLVSQTADPLREAVKAFIQSGNAHIIIDLSDVDFLDSMGLGTLVSLKVSALSAGYCTLEFVHLSTRVKELLSLTHLTSLFNS